MAKFEIVQSLFLGEIYYIPIQVTYTPAPTTKERAILIVAMPLDEVDDPSGAGDGTDSPPAEAESSSPSSISKSNMNDPRDA